MRQLIFLLSIAIPLAAQNSAIFVKADSATQGSWMGVYGSAGYDLIGGTGLFPIAPSGQSFWTWAASTTDPRGLQTVTGGRAAACWYGPQFTIDIQFPDTLRHQLAIYAVDWDSLARSERIAVLDGATGAILDSQTLSNFDKGTYTVWNVTGHVKLQFASLAGANAVVSGIFFDPVPVPSPVPPTTGLLFIGNGAALVSAPCPLGWTGATQGDGTCLAVKLKD